MRISEIREFSEEFSNIRRPDASQEREILRK
jgi:hypothetical protein